MFRLTGSKGVIMDDVIYWPALAVGEWAPDLLYGLAVNPGKDDAKTESDVDGYHDEPDDALDPAVGNAENGDCERGLAPGGGDDGKRASQVGAKKEGSKVAVVEAIHGSPQA